MADEITLIVNFRVGEPIRREFLASLQELFSHIVKEPKLIVDLKIERTPAWFSPIAEWKGLT